MNIGIAVLQTLMTKQVRGIFSRAVEKEGQIDVDRGAKKYFLHTIVNIGAQLLAPTWLRHCV